MAVPDYQSLMLPLLKFAEEQKSEISLGDAVEALAFRLELTETDRTDIAVVLITISLAARIAAFVLPSRSPLSVLILLTIGKELNTHASPRDPRSRLKLPREIRLR